MCKNKNLFFLFVFFLSTFISNFVFINNVFADSNNITKLVFISSSQLLPSEVITVQTQNSSDGPE